MPQEIAQMVTNDLPPLSMQHVSYPETGTFETSGKCPSTHPVKLPQLMFEVIWDTSAFNNKADWPADGSQPFTFSQGDTTGYGQHGDCKSLVGVSIVSILMRT
jgi:hypothetical protein